MHQTQSTIKVDHVKNYTTPLDRQLLYTISKPIRSKKSKTYQNKLFFIIVGLKTTRLVYLSYL